MHRTRTLVALGAASVIAATAIAPSMASAQSDIDELLTGLNSPKGVALLGRDVVVGQGAFGPPDPVLLYITSGRDRGATIPVSDPTTLVDVAISPVDGTGWGIVGDEDGGFLVVHQLGDGSVVEVLNTREYQATDPDPVDQEGNPTESNAYGLTIAPNGDALVADAAGNDIIRVTPDGDAWTVARFDVEATPTDHVGDPTLPPMIDAEAVPTTVTFGPDGDIYVGQLKGFPFLPGTSNVWRIDADAAGGWCSVNTPTSECEVYAGGLTAIQDIAFNTGGSRLYVLELAEGGVLEFEAGLGTGEFPDAVLLELRGSRTRELAAGQLSEPGGIAVHSTGNIYVTDGVFTGGRLVRI